MGVLENPDSLRVLENRRFRSKEAKEAVAGKSGKNARCLPRFSGFSAKKSEYKRDRDRSRSEVRKRSGRVWPKQKKRKGWKRRAATFIMGH
jgi:hypothetical protein